MQLSGVWLPIITPFLDGKIDNASYAKLINHFIAKGVDGIIPMGTTGESPTIADSEYERLIALTMDIGRVPVVVGAGGNDTHRALAKIRIAEAHQVDGVLSVCPYYNRPNQFGLRDHFLKLSEATRLNIVIYNIPYRTGVNLENDTLFQLAELSNIIGVKDSCGQIHQTLKLLADKPRDFSVMTGEDLLFFTTLVNGGNGGILASAHLHTEAFLDVYRRVSTNDHQGARRQWQKLQSFILLLFAEPNPAPVKHCLHRLNLIRSADVRMPLTPVSAELKKQLDSVISI